MDKNIKITIEGKTGTGKTHLTAYLYRILYNEGFSVSFNDIDLNNENIETMGTKEPINALKQNVSIDIITKQKNRTIIDNKPHHTHNLEWRDSSHYEYVCINCDTADSGSGGWGKLLQPCSNHLNK
jgi:CO dehydrogenase nickel-insertion accessory protein CooC1